MNGHGIIQVDDVTSMSTSLDPRALAAYKVHSTIYEWNEQQSDGSYRRKFCKTEYFGVTCDVTDIQKAVDLISRVINHAYAVDEDQVKGFLGGVISKVDMASTGPVPRCAVVTYIAVDEEASLILQEDFEGVSFKEGQILTAIEDIK